MKQKILVCDDETTRGAHWARQLRAVPGLEESYTIDVLEADDYRAAVTVLQERRKRARDSDASREPRSAIDEADILFVDYDLIGLDDATDTGEGLSYLARCYSDCGLIVDLNQFGQNVFDLSLDPHLQSFADVHLGSAQLSNPGLWTNSFDGFRPWAWPLLSEAAVALEARAELLVDRLHDRILDVLEFPETVAALLPRAFLDFFDGAATVETFVRTPEYGLRHKDEPIDDRAVARIVAARVAKWLEGVVLRGQEILVDAPHLGWRYPSLVIGDRSSRETWNSLARLSVAETDLPIRYQDLEGYRFRADAWLSRPAWFWEHALREGHGDKIANLLDETEAPYVFCEDVSRFLDIEHAEEFVSEVPSSWVRRYVLSPRAVTTGKFEEGDPRNPDAVDYRQAYRRSL